jgi:multiple sugar transport system permease protein
MSSMAHDAIAAGRRLRVGAARRDWVGLLYVAPAVALVLVYFVVPLGMTAWMSLHNWPLMGEHRFIGLDNYAAILRDVRFWGALKFTAYYTVVVTVAHTTRWS